MPQLQTAVLVRLVRTEKDLRENLLKTFHFTMKNVIYVMFKKFSNAFTYFVSQPNLLSGQDKHYC